MTRAILVATVWLAIAAARASAQGADPGTGAGGAAPADGTGQVSTSGDQVLQLEGADIPDFDKIRTPDSPAFTLLGVSPTQIERPTTPKAVTAVVGELANADLTVPRDFAVELSPYTLLSSGQPVNVYLQRPPFTQLWQNITVSGATAGSTRSTTDAMGTVTQHTDTTLSVGARTSVTLTGGPVFQCSKDELDTLMSISKNTAVTATPEGQALMRDFLSKLAASPADRDRLTAQYAQDTLALRTKLDARERDRLTSLCLKEVASAHLGLVVDLAGAMGFQFADSSATQGRYSLGAGWVDLAYSWKHATLVLVGRARDDKTSGKHDVFSDVGGRAIVAENAYAGSVEAIWRHGLDRSSTSTAPDNSYRLAVALDIHVTDSTWLSLAFGRDFASGDASSLFSLANLKYGLGDPKVTASTK